MPFRPIDQVRSFYRLEGNKGLPVLVLAHSIGCDHAMWAPQIPDLLGYFQVLRYDIRGHGASDATPGEYTVEGLGRDVLALAESLGIPKFAFCGLSLGGAIGQWLGAHASDRLTGLVLANTSPQFGPPANWNARIEKVRTGGIAAIVDLVMQRFFSAETLAGANPEASSVRSVLLGTDPVGYTGCCAALRDVNHTALLRDIGVPTLVIASDRDVATPWEGHGEILAREIPRAKALHLRSAHLSNLERPRSFTTAVIEFLLQNPASSADPLDAGFRVRREVLGDEHVDRAIEATTEFTREFQNLITRYGWGTIWTRPGLDKRTRRLLVLAMMASLGRWEEFRMHVRAALAAGIEPVDFKEVLLQAAIYAGVPVANTGFHIVGEEIEKTKTG